jgi:hypothetical protein
MTVRNNVGAGLEKAMSPEEVHDIKQEVRERFPDVDWPDLSQERLYVAGYDFAIDGMIANCIQEQIDEEHELWKHNVDGKVPRVVAICSEQYNFVPFEVASKKFVDFLDTYDGWGKPSIDFNIIDGGRKMKATATFNEHRDDIKSRAKVGDTICPVGGFYHGIDLDWMFRVWAGAERLICSNGMVGHHLNLELGKKHKSTLVIDEMIGSLAPTFEKYGEQIEIWNVWGETVIDAPQTEELIAASGFGTKHQAEILALPERSTGQTVEEWMNEGKVNVMNLYNVLTQFTSHELESDMVRVKRGEQIAQAFETAQFRRAA